MSVMLSVHAPRIVSDPDVMGGKPVIRGTRVTVEIVLRRLADGYTIPEMLEDWPHVDAGDIKEAVYIAMAILPHSSPRSS